MRIINLLPIALIITTYLPLSANATQKSNRIYVCKSRVPVRGFDENREEILKHVNVFGLNLIKEGRHSLVVSAVDSNREFARSYANSAMRRKFGYQYQAVSLGCQRMALVRNH